MIPLPGRTLVMGIINVTPDSFSDGGEWFDERAAISHGLELLAEGAARGEQGESSPFDEV